MRTALYIGRFQPPHKGHISVIKEILKNFDKVAIGVGSAQEKNTYENPFSAAERIKMLKLSLEDSELPVSKFIFIKINDTFDDVSWVKEVLKKAGKFDAAFTNNEWTKFCFQDKGIKTHGTQYFAPHKGELIRKKIAKGKPWDETVAQSVYEYILKIKGDTRIKNSYNKKQG
ncbi:TPA: nicotinamide-nucleotide adenylyltransferase [archaeon]|nr:nicotinamide-nucleotide adenylyltransferase [Candidatus Naiadarchaeales archaeon SRR2090153.bin461]